MGLPVPGVNIAKVSHGLVLLNPRRHKLYKRLKYRSPEHVQPGSDGGQGACSHLMDGEVERSLGSPKVCMIFRITQSFSSSHRWRPWLPPKGVRVTCTSRAFRRKGSEQVLERKCSSLVEFHLDRAVLHLLCFVGGRILPWTDEQSPNTLANVATSMIPM